MINVLPAMLKMISSNFAKNVITLAWSAKSMEQPVHNVPTLLRLTGN